MELQRSMRAAEFAADPHQVPHEPVEGCGMKVVYAHCKPLKARGAPAALSNAGLGTVPPASSSHAVTLRTLWGPKGCRAWRQSANHTCRLEDWRRLVCVWVAAYRSGRDNGRKHWSLLVLA